MKRIAIIGAGCSGLTAIKCCLEENLEPVCLEQETDIGGLWNFSRNLTERKGSVYNSCVINTSKEMMSYSDFPVPKHFPVFMPRRYVLEYFRLYAANFDLLPYIRFQTKVISITQSPDYMETGAWIVAYNNFGKTNEVLQERFDGVMVCTGHHAYPYLPKFTDHHLFQGPIIHSHDYRDPIPYAGKRVLIIGKKYPSNLFLSRLCTIFLMRMNHWTIYFRVRFTIAEICWFLTVYCVIRNLHFSALLIKQRQKISF